MEYIVYTSGNELYHHGIRGMKWGVRRYQNKDGSLTPAGKKRRDKLEGELEKLGGGKKATADEAPRKKTVSEMTDDELRVHTNRMQLESNYYNAARNLATANPRKVSKGEKFMNSLVNDVIAPAAKNTGKAYLEKFMKDKLGLKDEKPLSWEDKLKKQSWEKNQRQQEIDDIQREIDIIKKKAELNAERKKAKQKKDDD